jgi:hypothetical protein
MKKSCLTPAILTFIGIALSAAGIIMTAYGLKQGNGASIKPGMATPLNTLTIVGYTLSSVGSMMFLICGIIWIICAAGKK